MSQGPGPLEGPFKPDEDLSAYLRRIGVRGVAGTAFRALGRDVMPVSMVSRSELTSPIPGNLAQQSGTVTGVALQLSTIRLYPGSGGFGLHSWSGSIEGWLAVLSEPQTGSPASGQTFTVIDGQAEQLLALEENIPIASLPSSGFWLGGGESSSSRDGRPIQFDPPLLVRPGNVLRYVATNTGRNLEWSGLYVDYSQ